MNYVPITTKNKDKDSDIYSRLLQDRIILIFGEINDALAASVIAQLLYLESTSKEDIHIYINSPGGMVTSGLAIYDTIKYLSCNVRTIGMGLCASMGAFLLASGTKGKRFALENTKIMIHQPFGGVSGKATDIMIVAEDISKTKKQLNKILALNTDQPLERVEKDIEKDYYMSTTEAIEYGLIDDMLQKSEN